MERGDRRRRSRGESWQSYPQSAFLESITGHTLAVNKLWCREFPATLVCTPRQIGVENEIDKMDARLRAGNAYAHRQFRASPRSRKRARQGTRQAWRR